MDCYSSSRNKMRARVLPVPPTTKQQDHLPLPDYDDDDNFENDSTASSTASTAEIIQPKKLVNPVKESKLRMNVHKELLFNQKMGVSVLNKKTELEKTIAKIKGNHHPAAAPPEEEQEDPTTTNRSYSEFKKALMHRKKIIDNYETTTTSNLHHNQSKEEYPPTASDEFRRVHQKIFK